MIYLFHRNESILFIEKKVQYKKFTRISLPRLIWIGQKILIVSITSDFNLLDWKTNCVCMSKKSYLIKFVKVLWRPCNHEIFSKWNDHFKMIKCLEGDWLSIWIKKKEAILFSINIFCGLLWFHFNVGGISNNNYKWKSHYP